VNIPGHGKTGNGKKDKGLSGRFSGVSDKEILDFASG